MARADEPVVIVDLRPGTPAELAESRQALRDELGAIAGITVQFDKDLDAALSGAAVDQDATRVAAALAEAREAYGRLDCSKAAAAADRAIDDLAARQAAGLDDGPALKSAYAYVLLCADRDNDIATTVRAASRLRALGVTSGDDVGISASTWDHIPDIDAASTEIIAVTVEADQPGAEVWVDHAKVGPAPATVYVRAGEHVFAAAADGYRAASRAEIVKTQTLSLALPDQKGTWSELAGFIHAWRDKVTPPTNAGLTAIMAAAKVRFAIVLAGSHLAEVWGKGPDDQVAKKIDTAALSETLEIGAIVTDKVTAWDGHAPADQLLTETPEERDAYYHRGGEIKKAKWYVYASIAGAVLLGGAVIYFNEQAADTQRIVIRGP